MSAPAVRAAAAADRERWNGFLAASAGAEAGHGWEFHDLLARRFSVGLHRLIAERDGRIVAALPLVFQRSLVGRFLTSVPYLNHAGVLGDDAEARTALAARAAALAREIGAQRLELRGRDGSDLPLPVWEGKSDYRLALPRDPEALWSALRSKVRAQVRRPGKEGYEARVAAREELPRFYRLLARRWHELGSPVLPASFFEDLADVFGDAVRLVFVERDGRTAASGLLLRWRDAVEIPWAASDRAADRFGVNMLLYWTSLEHAARDGATRFEFGRSTPGTGNARFKLQWGAEERPLKWNVETAGRGGQASERGAARREWVARAWRRLPRFVTAVLGPRLAARIPY